jgi:uncharacterized membrane protein
MTMQEQSNGWKGPFYYNPSDPRVMVPRRSGTGDTPNFAHPMAYVVVLLPLFLGAIVVAAVVVTTVLSR